MNHFNCIIFISTISSILFLLLFHPTIGFEITMNITNTKKVLQTSLNSSSFIINNNDNNNRMKSMKLTNNINTKNNNFSNDFDNEDDEDDNGDDHIITMNDINNNNEKDYKDDYDDDQDIVEDDEDGDDNSIDTDEDDYDDDDDENIIINNINNGNNPLNYKQNKNKIKNNSIALNCDENINDCYNNNYYYIELNGNYFVDSNIYRKYNNNNHKSSPLSLPMAHKSLSNNHFKLNKNKNLNQKNSFENLNDYWKNMNKINAKSTRKFIEKLLKKSSKNAKINNLKMNHADHHYDNAINNNANNKQSTLNINDLDDDDDETLNKYNSHKLTNKILKKSKQRKSKWSTKMNDRINLNDDDDNNELCNEIVCNWNVEYCSIIDSTKAECVKKKKNKNRMINRKYSNLHYSNDDDDDSSSGDDESDDSNSSDDHSSSGYDDDFPYKIMHKSNQFKSNGIIIDNNNNKIKLFSNSKQQQQQQQNNGKYNNKNNYESTLANNNNNNNRWKMIQSNQINAIKHQFNVLGNNNHHQANNNRMKKLTYEQRNQRKLQNHQGQQPKQQQQQKNESTLKKHQNNDNDDDRHNKTIGCPSCNTISHNSNQQIICGTDNSTYSSMCRIDYHNCIHRKDVRFACFGFCPCSKLIHGPDSINNNHHQRMPMKASSTTATTTTMTTTSKIESKIRSNPINKDHNNNVEISLHLKLKNSTTNDTKKLNKQQQHYYYYHYDHMDNQTSHDHSNYSLINSNNNNNKCSSDELRSMGDRLLDWFTVVMQEELSRLAKSNNNENRTATLQQYNNTLTNSNKYLPDCDESVSFMFYHFDIDHNYKLTTNELYYLEHDENEHCLEPYLIQCDEDSNHLLTVYEWCSCFSLRSKPCLYHQKHLIQQQSNNNSKQNNANNNIEQFLPQCDENGHYRSVQCQSQSNKKFCWCSDKNGNEIAGTRVFGRMPICDKSYPLKRYYMNNNNNNQKQSKSINDLNRRESMINHKQYSKFYINNIKQSSSYNSWKYKDIDDDDDDDDDYGDNNNGNIVYNNEDDEDFNGQYDNHNKDIDDDDQDDDDSFQMDHGSGHLETF